ncbi:hypothetical protein SynMINOS11_01788 [Synechococcus sp. Minos11]|nr:hypothetical protein SynMINOS11_01788 [Synechococcus sp. Minos11]
MVSCRGKPHERQNLCDRLGGVFGRLHGRGILGVKAAAASRGVIFPLIPSQHLR